MKVNKQNIRIKHDGFEHQNVGFNLPTKHGGMNQQRHESITIERGEFKNHMNMSFKCPSLSFLWLTNIWKHQVILHWLHEFHTFLVGGFKPIETYVLELIILNQETISKDFKPTPESPKPVSQASLAQTLVTEWLHHVIPVRTGFN